MAEDEAASNGMAGSGEYPGYRLVNSRLIYSTYTTHYQMNVTPNGFTPNSVISTT